MAIGRNHRFGWILGIGVSVVSWVLYVGQETVGLPAFPRRGGGHPTSGRGRKFVGGLGPGGGVCEVEAAGGVEGVFG